MNAKHRRTLEAVFAVPARSDVEWKDVEALFTACGAALRPGAGSRVKVELNGAVAVFHRPHPEKEMSKPALRSLRSFFHAAGVTP